MFWQGVIQHSSDDPVVKRLDHKDLYCECVSENYERPTPEKWRVTEISLITNRIHLNWYGR
jgi:hypothetical protein